MDVVQDKHLAGAEHGGAARMLDLREVEQQELFAHRLDEGVELHIRARGDGEGDQHAGDGRVDAGLDEHVPNDESTDVVEEHVVDVQQAPAQIEQCGYHGHDDDARLEATFLQHVHHRHVLSTITSALKGSSARTYPILSSIPAMFSESCSFI